eukprot:comp21814_c0_seq1/m.31075 comp21814_c0_seq1/g.31075  ORF comp21814_c0_seq1/g.31075 comp21814_c0_seq1/m.31075 type:complete len:364 (-) comp21814_c0_seq1:643-1734(-)
MVPRTEKRVDPVSEAPNTAASRAPVMPKTTHVGPLKEFTRVDYNQPHWKRRKAIMAAHPEVEDLHVYDPVSAVWTVALVATMYCICFYLKDYSWGALFAVGYIFGAVVDHALWVLVHDLGHETAFKTKWLNHVFLLMANVPHIFPSAVTFKYYHKQHHTNLNETYQDPDIPGPTEQRLFGNSTLGKMGYLLFFPLLQVVRTHRYGELYFDRWVLLNYLTSIPINLYVLFFWGPKALFFLLVSSIFSIGLHPVGARWIAEHYALRPEQETYSYYGPVNLVAFNIGYHNEHHDLPRIPWSKLPALTKTAPEFYEPLYAHPSYLGLLWNFFTNPNFTLQSRVVRESKGVTKEEQAAYEGSDMKKAV